jgi:predicted TIM-barrel fold metal-dependent hydrolase
MVYGQPFFDAHLHVIDPRFPLVSNQRFTPAPYSAADYRHQAGQLLATVGFVPVGGAVVSGSFQGVDQSYLEAALKELGPGYVGVTQLAADTGDDELRRLDAIGVRAIRINLVRRVHVADLDQQLALARRARDLVGWHLELYIRSTDLAQLDGRLPDAAGLVIDHLGLTAAGLQQLLRLVEAGARVKATGFSRGDVDVQQTLRALHQANPGALMAGTDLPGVRTIKAVTAADLVLLRSTFEPDDLARVMHANARQLYRPAP